MQNDTLLKQLHQAVEINSSPKLDVSRQLISPVHFRRVDSISKADSMDAVSREFIPVLKKNRSLDDLYGHQDAYNMSPVTAIQPAEVVWLTEEVGKPTIVLPERKIERNTPDWMIGIFILLLALLATIRLFFSKYLEQLFSSTINYATASRMFRERSFSLTHASFRLDVMFYLVFSLFIFQTFETYLFGIQLISIVKFAIILAGVTVYFGLKRLAYFLQGSISDSLPETQEFLFNMNVYNRILGLFLLPVSLIIAFAPLRNAQIAIVGGVLVTAAFYFLLIFRGVKILMRKDFSIFYLILYLCTLEILPLFFIYKLVLV